MTRSSPGHRTDVHTALRPSGLVQQPGAAPGVAAPGAGPPGARAAATDDATAPRTSSGVGGADGERSMLALTELTEHHSLNSHAPLTTTHPTPGLLTQLD